ncbi:MAG: RNA polymerase sigma factor RpoD, partial [Proteobacteria bacterium]|nr:RNA polymerase sigma factor RpoD [Pseudomonadota bacterium]
MTAKTAKNKTEEKRGIEDEDSVLDMSQAAVKKMIIEARERGYITYDQLNKVLPADQIASEQIEDVMSMLSEMGINIVEDEDVESEEESLGATDLVEANHSKEVTISTSSTEVLDRTDDPVRMYLREMGAVELLSREGEIAIAKRIEAGRGTMILGLCESPLTFQAITIWRDELLTEEILLRDVIDLETTFGDTLDEESNEGNIVSSAQESKKSSEKPEVSNLDADGNLLIDDDDYDDDDEQANMSLAAMEEALKPKALKTLDLIAQSYTKLSEMQDSRLSAT